MKFSSLFSTINFFIGTLLWHNFVLIGTLHLKFGPNQFNCLFYPVKVKIDLILSFNIIRCYIVFLYKKAYHDCLLVVNQWACKNLFKTRIQSPGPLSPLQCFLCQSNYINQFDYSFQECCWLYFAVFCFW